MILSGVYYCALNNGHRTKPSRNGHRHWRGPPIADGRRLTKRGEPPLAEEPLCRRTADAAAAAAERAELIAAVEAWVLLRGMVATNCVSLNPHAWPH